MILGQGRPRSHLDLRSSAAKKRNGSPDSGKSQNKLDKVKTTFLNIDGLVGAGEAASAIVLSPNISFSAVYVFYVLGALYSFFTAIFQLFSKKNDFTSALYHFFGLAGAGYVLVYWASYSSALASFVAEGVILVVGLVAGLATYKGGPVIGKGVKEN